MTSDIFSPGDRGQLLILCAITPPEAPVEFRAPVQLVYHDSRHQPQREDREIPTAVEDPVSVSVLNAPARLSFEGSLLPARESRSGLPEIVICARGQQLPQAPIDLPDTGIEGILKVRGDFPDAEWPVLLCKEPHLECSLQGRGIRPRAANIEDPDDWEWAITDFSRLQLTLNLTIRSAPVYIAKPSSPEAGDDNERASQSPVRYLVTVKDEHGQVLLTDEFREHHAVQAKPPLLHVKQPLRSGQRLAPSLGRHTHPIAIPIQLNCNELQPGWKVELQIEIDRAGTPQGTLVGMLVCKCVDLGKIRVDPPQISLTSMFAGERRSNAAADPGTNPEGAATVAVQKALRLKPVIDAVEVSNGGSSTVGLRPVIDRATDWLRVGWDIASSMDDDRIDTSDPTRITLQPEQSCRLLIELDFRHIAPRTEPLMARVALFDATTAGADGAVELGELSILIQRVEAPTVAESPLFLDFGNSNTTAAVQVRSTGGQPVIRPGHDYGNSEHFPTVLLLTRLNLNDPAGSEGVIGPFAVDLDELTRGPDNLSRLVTGLKQRLCRLPTEEFASEVSCHDISNENVWMNSTDLLTLFLREMVRRAETLLRGRYLERLVISYPARLSPGQRRDYFAAFRAACQRISKDPDRLATPLQLEESAQVDEANAVAIGFAYGSDTGASRAIDDCLKRTGGRMRVAAIDLGGGSLDIACLDFRNLSRLPVVKKWTSRYVWIGGDVRFGGNNLTAATFEILRERLQNHLRELPASAAGSAEDQFSPSRLLDRLLEIPQPDDYFLGRAADRAARFMAMWNVAEAVKLAALNPDRHPDRKSLIGLLAVALRITPEVAGRLLFDGLWPRLPEIEQHRVRCDQHGDSNYVIVERLEKAIEELAREAARRIEGMDFVVIGGGASPWPRLREIVTRHFPSPTVIIFNPERLKSRVAEGLALSWPAMSSPAVEQRPACSGNYTTATLGIVEPYGQQPQAVFSICTPIRTLGEPVCWHELRLLDHPDAESRDVLEAFRRQLSDDASAWELTLCRMFDEEHWVSIGVFSSLRGISPPPPIDSWKSVSIGFGTDEDDLQLRIETMAGDFWIIPHLDH